MDLEVNGTEQTFSVTFDAPFSVPPNIQLTVQRYGYAAQTHVEAREVTTSQFSLIVVGEGSTSKATIVHWLATGE